MSTTPDAQYVDLLRRYRAAGGVELREQLHARYLELERGGTTAGGLPYPDPTDPVAEGADAIRALAEALDPKLAEQVIPLDTMLSTGWTAASNPPRLYVTGRRVDLIGGATRSGTSGATGNILLIPEATRPAATTFLAGVVTSGGQAVQLLMSLGGTLSIAGNYWTATPGSGVIVPLAGTWYLEERTAR